jgi:lysozyme family protein
MKLVAEADPKELIVAICEKRLAFLQALPTWDTFGKGWGRRVKETEETALKMAQ